MSRLRWILPLAGAALSSWTLGDHMAAQRWGLAALDGVTIAIWLTALTVRSW